MILKNFNREHNYYSFSFCVPYFLRYEDIRRNKRKIW
nr:MAG TPA: hypothetical protein [Caudoviricetes sp.]DAS83281.1 MAG TPA: hypothetical protein [Caudoviricetes sp.]